MHDFGQMACRGAHAERELCRLIGAVLDGVSTIHAPARGALDGLPADLSDVGGMAELVMEIIRTHKVYTAAEVAEVALSRGVDACAIGLGSFLAECMDTPAFQPTQAVESVVNFSLYCNQIRSLERLQTAAWTGKRIPELTSV